VVTPPQGATPGSRRELFSRAAGVLAGSGVAGALALSGCGSRGSRPSVHDIPRRSRAVDLSLLRRGLDLEHQAIAAYTAGIPLLRGRQQAAAKRFLDQELSHAGELAGLIRQAGGKFSRPGPSYQLGHPREPRDVLRLVARLEQAQLSWYLTTISSLTPGSVRAAIATVLSSDAQHLAVLRSMTGMRALDGPFISGRE
jgi:rubrerythrin